MNICEANRLIAESDGCGVEYRQASRLAQFHSRYAQLARDSCRLDASGYSRCLPRTDRSNTLYRQLINGNRVCSRHYVVLDSELHQFCIAPEP